MPRVRCQIKSCHRSKESLGFAEKKKPALLHLPGETGSGTQKKKRSSPSEKKKKKAVHRLPSSAGKCKVTIVRK